MNAGYKKSQTSQQKGYEDLTDMKTGPETDE